MILLTIQKRTTAITDLEAYEMSQQLTSRKDLQRTSLHINILYFQTSMRAFQPSQMINDAAATIVKNQLLDIHRAKTRFLDGTVS